jgi:hypothetical protein
MATVNVTLNYGVEVRRKGGGVYTAYVEALSADHAKQQVKKTLERGEYISAVYVNTPKPLPS